MTSAFTVDQFLSNLRADLAEVNDAIELWIRPGVMRGENWVVRSSPGLYLRRISPGVYQPESVLRASIWGLPAASRIAEAVMSRDGSRAEPVYYLAALENDRDSLVKLIAVMERAVSLQGLYSDVALPQSVDDDLEASHVSA